MPSLISCSKRKVIAHSFAGKCPFVLIFFANEALGRGLLPTSQKPVLGSHNSLLRHHLPMHGDSSVSLSKGRHDRSRINRTE